MVSSPLLFPVQESEFNRHGQCLLVGLYKGDTNAAVPLFGIPEHTSFSRPGVEEDGTQQALQHQAENAHLFISGESPSEFNFPPPPYTIPKAGTRPDHASPSKRFLYAKLIKNLKHPSLLTAHRFRHYEHFRASARAGAAGGRLS